MRKIYIIIFLITIFRGILVNAQTAPNSVYYDRLYYTAKVWGFLKYFQSEVAKGSKNWDSALIQTLQKVKNDLSNQDFNETLKHMLNSAGEMAVPNSQPPDIPESLKYNLDFIWLSNTVLSDEVKAKMDTVKTRFRPQENYYVEQNAGASNPTFGTDDQFYQWGVNQYPEEAHWLLALLI